MRKPILSRVLAVVLALVIGVLTPCTVFAQEPVEELNYVSLGDSVSNGYGFDDYYPNGDKNQNLRGFEIEAEAAYPSLFADYLEQTTGKQVNHTQLACSAMRPADIYFILRPDAVRDDYFNRVYAAGSGREEWISRWYNSNHPAHGTPEQAEQYAHDEFVDAITNADVITVSIGYNNLGTFLSGRINLPPLMYAYGDNDTLQEMLDNLGSDVNVAEIKAKVFEIVNRYGGVDLDNVLREASLQAHDMGLPVDANELVDLLVYAYVSFAVYWTLMMDEIYKLNPDVEVVALSLYNLQEGFRLSYGDTIIDIGQIYGAMLELENLYIAAGDKNNDKYYFADANAGKVVRFFDELAANEPSPSLRHRVVEELLSFTIPVDDGQGGTTNAPLHYVLNATLKQYALLLKNVLTGWEMDFDQLGASDDMEAFMAAVCSGAIYVDANYINSNDVDAVIADPSAAPRLALVEEAVTAMIATLSDPSSTLLSRTDAISAVFGENGLYATPAELIAAMLYKIFPLLSAAASYDPISIEETLPALAGGMGSFGALLAGGNIDPSVFGLLNLYLRFLMSEGICVHPAAAGHQALFEACKEAYNNKVSARETAINEVLRLISEYGPVLADQALKALIDYAEDLDEKFGIMEDLTEKANNITDIVKDLEDSVELAGGVLGALPEYLAGDFEDALEAALEEIFDLGDDLEDILFSLSLDTNDVQRVVDAILKAIENEKAILQKTLLTLEIAKEAAHGSILDIIDAIITAVDDLDEALDYAFNDTIDNAEYIISILGDAYGEKIPELKIAAASIVAGLDALQEFVNQLMKDACEDINKLPLDLLAAAGSAFVAITAAIQGLEGYDLDGALTSFRDFLVALVATLGIEDELNLLAELAGKKLDEQIQCLMAKLRSFDLAAIKFIDKADDILKKVFQYAAIAYKHLTETEDRLGAYVTQLNDIVEALMPCLDAWAKTKIDEGMAHIIYEDGRIRAFLYYIDDQLYYYSNFVLDYVYEVNGAVEALISAIYAFLQLKLDEGHQHVFDKMAYIENELEPMVDAYINQKIAEGLLHIEEMDAVIQEYGHSLEAFVAEKAQEGIDMILDELSNYTILGMPLDEELKAMIEDAPAYFAEKWEELQAAYDLVMLSLEMMKAFSGFGYYGIDPRYSYYVSLGDSVVTGMGLDGYSNYGFDVKVDEAFPTLLANELGVNYRQLAIGGLRAIDMLYILDDTFQGDEYARTATEATILNHTGGTSADLRALYTSEIAKADLVSITMGGNEFGTFYNAQMAKFKAGEQPYEMDFAQFLGAETVDLMLELTKIGASIVNEILSAVEAQLGYEVVSDDAIAELCFQLEVFTYSALTFIASYSKVLDKIHEISPDALIIIVGLYNTIDDLYFDNGTVFIDVGRYVGYLVEAANIAFMTYALDSDYAMYVDIPDVIMFTDEDENRPSLNMADGEYLPYMSNGNGEASHPSAEGHEYIFEQILLNLYYEYLYLPGDTDYDWDVDPDDAIYLLYNLTWPEAYPVYQDTDYNNDGICDEQDAVYLLYYQEWPEYYPLYPSKE